MQQINLPKTQPAPTATPVKPQDDQSVNSTNGTNDLNQTATPPAQATQAPMQMGAPQMNPSVPFQTKAASPVPNGNPNQGRAFPTNKPGMAPFASGGWDDGGDDSWDTGFNDPWSDPWGTPPARRNNGGGSGNAPKKLTPQERVEMIEKLYNEVLSRKPDTRDINYYKYSTLSEEEIRKQLITGKEHTQVIADGREFSKMRDRAEQAETRVKMLESQIKDQVEEFRELTELLQQKNQYIQSLREQAKNPYNLISHPEAFTMNSSDHYVNRVTTPAKPVTLPPQATPTPVLPKPAQPEVEHSYSLVDTNDLNQFSAPERPEVPVQPAISTSNNAPIINDAIIEPTPMPELVTDATITAPPVMPTQATTQLPAAPQPVNDVISSQGTPSTNDVQISTANFFTPGSPKETPTNSKKSSGFLDKIKSIISV